MKREYPERERLSTLHPAVSHFDRAQRGPARSERWPCRAVAPPTRSIILPPYYKKLALSPKQVEEVGTIQAELKEVLALDEEGPLEGANPVRPDGTVKLDASKVRQCQAAMVKTLARRPEPILVIVLGGAHDLSAAVRELTPGAEYLRVTTGMYRQVSGAP